MKWQILLFLITAVLILGIWVWVKCSLREKLILDLIELRAGEEALEMVEPENLDSSILVLSFSGRDIKVVKSPNTERASVIINYFFKLFDTYKDLEYWGKLAIGTEDSYSEDVKGILVFSRKKNSNGHVLIPDLYAMQNYENILDDEKDSLPFKEKKDMACFVGVDTGDKDPLKNRRMQLCNWALDQKNLHCKISKIHQLKEKQVSEIYPRYKSFISGEESVKEQRTYKYLINMDGNTCAWNRFVWQLASNSVCLKEETDNINWYYPLLEEGRDYIGFRDYEEILDVLEGRRTFDPNWIISNANDFVKSYLKFDKQSYYTYCLLKKLQQSF